MSSEKVAKATLELEVENEVFARLGVPDFPYRAQTIHLWDNHYRFNLWKLNEDGYAVDIPHTFFVVFSRHDGFIHANPVIERTYGLKTGGITVKSA